MVRLTITLCTRPTSPSTWREGRLLGGAVLAPVERVGQELLGRLLAVGDDAVRQGGLVVFVCDMTVSGSCVEELFIAITSGRG